MTENQESESKLVLTGKPSKYLHEADRIRALAGANVPRYPDGRPVLFLNSSSPLSFEEYKRLMKAQKRMASMGRVHMMQWSKTRSKGDKRFLFGKVSGE